MALVLGGITFVSGQESEDEMCIPMGIIELGPPESVEPVRSAVEFPHSGHFRIVDCATCHHKWAGDEQIKTCMTSGCHDVAVSPAKSAKGKADKEQMMRYFKTAYHQMCIGCHKEIKKKNKELEMSYRKLDKPLPNTGPISCNDCHPRE
jgi:hypothetical protein